MGAPVFDGHTWIFPLLTEVGSIRPLNWSLIIALVSTPPAPFAGSTRVTLGRLVLEVVPVWNVKVPGLSRIFPAISVMADVTVMMYVVFEVSAALGVNVMR